MSPAMVGRFLTTVPRGKPYNFFTRGKKKVFKFFIKSWEVKLQLESDMTLKLGRTLNLIECFKTMFTREEWMPPFKNEVVGV